MLIPKISIITINLNNNRGLLNTIASIEQQWGVSYEHIIIDGDSIDESKNTIIQYKKRSKHLAFWLSEKDNGVYNAMNKGIAQAHGEYLLFLNSGDYLEPNILCQAEKQLTGEDIIYGDLLYVSNDNRKELLSYPTPPFSVTQIISQDFYLPHPASFIKRELFSDEGYNENYKIVSDWEFWVKNILFKNCTIKYTKLAISNFIAGGLSSKSENLKLILSERENVLQNLLSPKVVVNLRKFAIAEQSPLFDTIFILNRSSKRFQMRMNKLLLLAFKIRCFFCERNQIR